MDEKYKNWIEDTGLTEPQLALGQCIEITKIMQSVFPELTIRKGVVFSKSNIDNYSDTNYKEYTHAWLTTNDGEIIDPTVSQFCLLGDLQYKELDTSKPIFKCAGCGKYSYGNSYYCDDCSLIYSDIKGTLNG